ncbi:class IV aminotransferase [Pseudonocardiaceae bacterium YIM PH 21723]|nr:class IV aminotransferase [Pseudonocardiaceae bacterium YIM PH 21723]
MIWIKGAGKQMRPFAFTVVEINGRPPAAADLIPIVMINYGHTSSMEIRSGRVRGLDLHLHRLDTASKELFGLDLDGDRVRDYLRSALTHVDGDASARVVVFQPHPDVAALSVLVGLRKPTPTPAGPWRLRSAEHGRAAAHLKHVGSFGSVYLHRQAKETGFDETVLVDADGVIAEGAITNVGFLDGGTVIWPTAPALNGITQQLVRRQLTAAGVPMIDRRVRLTDVPSFDGAFLTNSWGVIPVSAVDDHAVPLGNPLADAIIRRYGQTPFDLI